MKPAQRVRPDLRVQLEKQEPRALSEQRDRRDPREQREKPAQRVRPGLPVQSEQRDRQDPLEQREQREQREKRVQ